MSSQTNCDVSIQWNTSSNKEDITIGTHPSRNEWKNHYISEKKEKKSTKSVGLLIYDFRNCQLICGDTKQISGCRRMRVERVTGYMKGPQTVLESVEIVIMLIVVMVSQVYTYVTIHRCVYFKCAIYQISIIPQ